MLPLKRRLLEAFEAAAGSDDVPGSVVKSLDEETRDLIVHEYVNAFHRRITRDSSDPRQFWLDLGLPQFSHVALQNGDSLEQYRAETERLAARIKSYAYARCSDEKLNRDKKELRERMRLDANIAPIFAGDKTQSMTIDRAIEIYAQKLKTPAREQRRRASERGVKARLARTKNQQLPVTEK